MHNTIEHNGALWKKDERDYLVEDILGAEEWETSPLPLKFFHDIAEYNQNEQKETYFACTCYGAYHATKASYELAKKVNVELDVLTGFRKQKDFGTFQEGVGDWLRTAFDSVIKNGVLKTDGSKIEIAGYASIGNGQSIDKRKLKYYLSNNFGIVTSFVTKKDYDYKTSGYLAPTTGQVNGGHAVSIAGYEDGYFICRNSYGSKWGKFKNGTFRILEKDLFLLQGIYVLYPKQKINMIFDDVSENSPHAEDIQWAKDKGLMTGENGKFHPDRPLSRRELAIVLRRYDSLR